MEQHPIPRQITTFEFKLIGFMTLKQFIYLIVFVPIAYIVFSVFPIPVLNFLLAAIIAFVGIAFAFIPINDRPLDVFVRNFFKRLSSPTQYFYNKNVQSHSSLGTGGNTEALIDAKKKLADYIASTQNIKGEKPKNDDANHTPLAKEFLAQEAKEEPVVMTQIIDDRQKDEAREAATLDDGKPYLVGEVKNNKQAPLPGLLVYIKDQGGKPLRLLKTNPSGVFATYKPLPKGEYTFEVKDPKGKFVFDTMKMNLEGQNLHPIEFFSKELI